MKILIVWYSRTGVTKLAGEKMAELLSADTDEIIDNKNRSGVLGYLMSGKDSLFKKPTEIQTAKDPKDYDLVIVGTPIWAYKMAPAVRMYLEQNIHNFKNIAFFATEQASGSEKAFEEMEQLVNKKTATSVFLSKEVKNGAFLEKLKKFIETLGIVNK
ncbi:MAG: hypothetical protein HZB76_02470 [Chlamydiae bacterium]|nr:hypothetical protein [Chlamydiota bacterium]